MIFMNFMSYTLKIRSTDKFNALKLKHTKKLDLSEPKTSQNTRIGEPLS